MKTMSKKSALAVLFLTVVVVIVLFNLFKQPVIQNTPTYTNVNSVATSTNVSEPVYYTNKSPLSTNDDKASFGQTVRDSIIFNKKLQIVMLSVFALIFAGYAFGGAFTGVRKHKMETDEKIDTKIEKKQESLLKYEALIERSKDPVVQQQYTNLRNKELEEIELLLNQSSRYNHKFFRIKK